MGCQTYRIVPGGSYGTPAPGSAYAIWLQSVTAMNPLANGDACMTRQTIEGNKLMRLGWGYTGAQPLSYCFHLYSTISGIAFVRLMNNATNRSYYQEFSVTGGQWNFITGTIPGDTTGTWTVDNSAGIYFDIVTSGMAAAGQAPNVWTTNTPVNKTTNSTNLYANNNNLTLFTNFFLIPGIQLPAGADIPLLGRAYDVELTLCMRYYEKIGMRLVTTTPPYANSVWYKVHKRAAPTITLVGGSANSATVGGQTNNPEMGMSQIGAATAAVDAQYAIDARV
jgi:hypothetical protein